MAALLPALAGLASAASAVATKAKGKQKRRAVRKMDKAVVLYDQTFAHKQLQSRSGQRRRATLVTVPKTHKGLSFQPTGLQSAAYIGKTMFQPCGAANPFADVSNDGSLKIRGRGLLGRQIPSVVNGTVIAANFSAIPGAIGTNVNSVGTMGLIGPGSLDPRLLNIAGIFAYVAIRKLDLQYVPSVSQYNYSVGVAPAAAGSSSLVTFGLTDQSDYLYTAPPTSAQQIADLPASVTGPCYQPMTLRYEHNGSRVYYTSSIGNSADANEHFQLILAGIFHQTPPAGATNTQVGAWHADWEVDFYRPMYPQVSVSAFADELSRMSSLATAGEIATIQNLQKKMNGPIDAQDVKGWSSHGSDVKDRYEPPDKVGAVAAAAARTIPAPPPSPTASLDGSVLVSKRDYAAVLKHVKEVPSGLSPVPLVKKTT